MQSVISYSYPSVYFSQGFLFLCVTLLPVHRVGVCLRLAPGCFTVCQLTSVILLGDKDRSCLYLLVFRKPAVSVCQGGTGGNLACGPLRLPLSTCVCPSCQMSHSCHLDVFVPCIHLCIERAMAPRILKILSNQTAAVIHVGAHNSNDLQYRLVIEQLLA